MLFVGIVIAWLLPDLIIVAMNVSGFPYDIFIVYDFIIHSFIWFVVLL